MHLTLVHACFCMHLGIGEGVSASRLVKYRHFAFEKIEMSKREKEMESGYEVQHVQHAFAGKTKAR